MDGHKKEEEASKSKPFYFTYIYYSSDSELFVFFFQIRLPQAWSSSAATGQSSYYPQAISLHSTCLQKKQVFCIFFLHKTNLFQIFSTSYNRKNCLVDMIELFKIAFQPKIQYQKSNYLIILQLNYILEKPRAPFQNRKFFITANHCNLDPGLIRLSQVCSIANFCPIFKFRTFLKS